MAFALKAWIRDQKAYEAKVQAKQVEIEGSQEKDEELQGLIPKEEKELYTFSLSYVFDLAAILDIPAPEHEQEPKCSEQFIREENQAAGDKKLNPEYFAYAQKLLGLASYRVGVGHATTVATQMKNYLTLVQASSKKWKALKKAEADLDKANTDRDGYLDGTVLTPTANSIGESLEKPSRSDAATDRSNCHIR